MKTILMALALGVFTYAGAEAQICKCKKVETKRTTAVRHKTVHHHIATPPTQDAVVTENLAAVACRQVPYEVCKINDDRRSVTCYQTTDVDNLTPLNNNVTTYGATGAIPGEPEQQNVKTIVVNNNKNLGNYCKRDNARRETVCTYNGERLLRDPWGYYYYSNDQR